MYNLNKLNNGLQTLTVPMSGTKTVTVLAMVKTGSRYETKENNGISHFLEHMFFKGTEKRPTSIDIAGELDGVGGEYNAFTGKEYTGFFAKVGSGKTELAMDVVSDILANSKFEEEEIKREKGVIVEEINMYHDNPLIYIEDVFEQCLYGDTPLGREILGPKENIKKFSQKDFLDYFKTQYSAGNIFLVVAGDISPEEGQKLAGKYFGEQKNTEYKGRENITEAQEEPAVKAVNKDTDQVNFSLGVRSYGAGDPKNYALKVLSSLLGGSMSSRLFTEVREKQGLAYYIKTQTETFTDGGYLTARAGVPVEKLEQAVKTVLNEYRKLTAEKPEERELRRTKDMIRGRSVISLESSDHVSLWYAENMVLEDKVLTPEEFLSKIDRVTAEDVREVAEDIFKENNLNLAVIGPNNNEENLKEILKL
jgi:predicted Zn-dependent peptidase